MENDLGSADKDVLNLSHNDQQANISCNGRATDSSYVASNVTTPFLSTSSLAVMSPVGPSPVKALSNIQPKLAEGSHLNQRPLFPKNDLLASAVQQLTSATPQQPPQPQQPPNLIVPQGIQHVLINGQLYPIIQTANGTHLLIQQPVGQAQHAGKQVFTAQPIQLGAVQQQPQLGKLPTSQLSQSVVPGTSQHLEQHPNPSITSSNAQQLPLTPDKHSVSNDVHQIGMSSSMGPVLPPTTSQVVHTSSSSNNLPHSSASSSQQRGKTSSTGVSNTSALNKNLVAVDSRTQQLLTRIQSQIDAFKSKPSLDADARATLQQLQEAQQKVLNNVREQAPKAQQSATATQGHPTNGVLPTSSQAPPFVHPNPQLIRPELSHANFKKKLAIIRPVAEGVSAVTPENEQAIVEAFTNVKVGNQIYNIQLMEDQKKSFIESMSKMKAKDQHVFVTQQQAQILHTVFKNQQDMQQRAQSTASQQPVQHPLSQSTLQTTTAQPSPHPSPRPTGKPRGRRSGNRGGKKSSNSRNFTQPLPPTVAQPITIPDAVASAVKKPRPTMSTKRIGERMLQQIMKDQEILLKPGNHKKSFATKNQVKERLLRFHLFYTAEPYKGYRRLQEEQLYRTTAHETVLAKEKLVDRFRELLWRDSTNPAQTAEDILISELLLQDEKEAFLADRLMEQEDIVHFQDLYRQPEPEPTPSPPPVLSPSPPPLSMVQPEPVEHPGTPPDTTTDVTTDTTSNIETLSQPIKPARHKPNSSTLMDFLDPEADVLRRVKRETAREAREQRAEKRRAADASGDISGTSAAINKKGKRNKRRRLSVSVPLSDQCDESQDTSSPISATQSPSSQSGLTAAAIEEYSKQSADNERVSDTLSEQSGLGSDELSSGRQTDVETRLDGRSEGSTVDSEDELIDIGSPPSPLPLPAFSTPHAQSATPEPLPLLNPPPHTYTSSPKKGFSICSETVIEQFEQPDNSYDQRSSHINSSSPENAEQASDDSDTSDGSDSQESVSDENSNPNYSDAAQHHTWHRLEVEPVCTSTQTVHRSTESVSAGTYLTSLPAESIDTNGGNDNLADNNSSFDDSTDDHEDDGDGGIPVSWEDNTEYVPSEAASEVGESSRSHSPNDEYMFGDDEVEGGPIMPLRINKKKLGDKEFLPWDGEDANEQSSPSIKLKINNPLPPPIKLRIKRDGNDKWEAASSVSSYTSEANMSGGEHEGSDSEQQLEGGVAVGWEDNSDVEHSEYNSEQSEVSMYGSDSGHQAEQMDEEDDNMPFVQYTVTNESNEHYNDQWQ